MLLYTCSYNSQMRVQLCGTELRFITLTHMLITIYSYDFSCLKLHTDEARVFNSSLIAYLPTSHISSPHTFCLLNFYWKTDLSDELVPTDWLLTDWPLVYPGFSISSKFQIKSDGSYWLEMLNFVISSWLKVTILNTLNPLVPIYITLLPLSQPVWTPTPVILGCRNGQGWLIWDPSSKI